MIGRMEQVMMNRSMLMVLLAFLVTPVIAFADGNDDTDDGRAFVSGGITDKPFIHATGGGL